MKPRTMTAQREAGIERQLKHAPKNKYVHFTHEEVAELLSTIHAERAVSKALADALRTCREYVEHDGCVTIADNALAQYAASFPEKEINLEPR